MYGLTTFPSSWVLTLIALAIVSLVSLGVSWTSRYDRRISPGIFRLGAMFKTTIEFVYHYQR